MLLAVASFLLLGASHCQGSEFVYVGSFLLLRGSSLREGTSLLGASECWELLIGGRRRTHGRLLTVRSFSLSCAPPFLGASCCREGTSHCQEEFAVGMFLYSVGKGCGHIRAAHELSHVLCTTLMELLSVGQSTPYPSRISL